MVHEPRDAHHIAARHRRCQDACGSDSPCSVCTYAIRPHALGDKAPQVTHKTLSGAVSMSLSQGMGTARL